MAATITHAAIGAAAAGLASAAIHQAALDQATIANIDKTNMDGATKVVTVGAAAPAVSGELAWNTTTLVPTGPSTRLQGFDAAAGVALDFAEALYSASTPAAAYQIVGLLWRDMTLHIWRRWESATTSPSGVAGWHPIDSGYQLWLNGSAIDPLPANRIVVNKPTGTADVRTFTTTVTAKDQAVLGVTLESIALGAYGVVAMVSGGSTCSVLVDSTEANGVVAQGDFLCTYTTAGESRTVGPQSASGLPAANKYTFGTPRGAYAIALGVKDGGNLVKVKLLGHVGAGALGMQANAALWSDTTPVTTANIDASVLSNGDATQGAVSSVINTKHLPLVAVDLVFKLQASATGSPASVTVTFAGTTPGGPTLAFYANGAGTGLYGGMMRTGMFGLESGLNRFDIDVVIVATASPVDNFGLFLGNYLY